MDMDIDSHPQQHHHQPSTSSSSSHPQPHSHSHSDSTTPQPQPQPQSHPSSSSQNKKSNLTNRPAGSKEAKKEADQEDSSDVRQPRAKVGFVSCDNCRRRKIRCIREEELETGSGSASVNDGPNPKTQYAPGPEGGPDLRCVQCKVQGKECRFDYVLKKPGPRTGVKREKSLAALKAKSTPTKNGTSTASKRKGEETEGDDSIPLGKKTSSKKASIKATSSVVEKKPRTQVNKQSKARKSKSREQSIVIQENDDDNNNSSNRSSAFPSPSTFYPQSALESLAETSSRMSASFQGSSSPAPTFPATVHSIRGGGERENNGGSGTYTPTGGFEAMQINPNFSSSSISSIGVGEMRHSPYGNHTSNTRSNSFTGESHPHYDSRDQSLSSRNGSFGGGQGNSSLLGSSLLQSFSPLNPHHQNQQQHSSHRHQNDNPPSGSSSHSQMLSNHPHSLSSAGPSTSPSISIGGGGNSSSFFDPVQPPQQQQQQPSSSNGPSILSPNTTSFSHHQNLTNRPPSNDKTDSLHPKSSKDKGPRLTKVFARPVESPRSLDDIAPRQTFLSIVALYFTHLYPLMPLVHRGRFSHDLLGRRDEKDQSFLCFVLSLTAYTIIQCPRSVIPAPWQFYRKLHQICHLTSRRMQPRRYDPPELIHVTTIYCDHIYLGSTGSNNAANSTLGEAIRTAITLRLHDERGLNVNGQILCPSSNTNDSGSSVGGLGLGLGSSDRGNGMSGIPSSDRPAPIDAIEHELRRRVYWILVGSDTTIAVLQNEPILLRDFDSWGVEFSSAVDDDLITAAGCYSQPIIERGPSVLTGFQTVSRLHQLLRELLEAYRQDKRYPPTEYAHTLSSLRYITASLARVRQILADMPDELKTPKMVPSFRPAPAMRNMATFPDITLSTGWIPAAKGGGNYGFRPFSGFFPDLFSHSENGGNGFGNNQQQSQFNYNNNYQQQQQQQNHQPEPPSSFTSGSQIWPRDMFDTNGLPNADAKSNSSTQPSPRSSIAHMSQLSTPTHIYQNPNHSNLNNNDPSSSTSNQDMNHDFTSQFPIFQSQYSPELSYVPLPLEQPPAPSIQQLNAAVNRVETFIQNPSSSLLSSSSSSSSQPPTLSPWATMRANILVTEAMIRFVLVEYRDLIDGLLSKQQVGNDGMKLETDVSADQEWEAAAKDMLDVFNGMPLDALASNGQSMIAKIIYIVSALLNRTSANTRSHGYLCDFLALLSKLSADRTAPDGNTSESNNDSEMEDAIIFQ